MFPEILVRGGVGVPVAVGSIEAEADVVWPGGTVGFGLEVGEFGGTEGTTVKLAFSDGAETVRICEVPMTLLAGSRSVTFMLYVVPLVALVYVNV